MALILVQGWVFRGMVYHFWLRTRSEFSILRQGKRKLTLILVTKEFFQIAITNLAWHLQAWKRKQLLLSDVICILSLDLALDGGGLLEKWQLVSLYWIKKGCVFLKSLSDKHLLLRVADCLYLPYTFCNTGVHDVTCVQHKKILALLLKVFSHFFDSTAYQFYFLVESVWTPLICSWWRKSGPLLFLLSVDSSEELNPFMIRETSDPEIVQHNNWDVFSVKLWPLAILLSC